MQTAEDMWADSTESNFGRFMFGLLIFVFFAAISLNVFLYIWKNFAFG